MPTCVFPAPMLCQLVYLPPMQCQLVYLPRLCYANLQCICRANAMPTCVFAAPMQCQLVYLPRLYAMPTCSVFVAPMLCQLVDLPRLCSANLCICRAYAMSYYVFVYDMRINFSCSWVFFTLKLIFFLLLLNVFHDELEAMRYRVRF